MIPSIPSPKSAMMSRPALRSPALPHRGLGRPTGEEPAASGATAPTNSATAGYGRLGQSPPPPPPSPLAYSRRGGWEAPKSRDPRHDFHPKPSTHRPTSYGPLLPDFVSDHRRPRGDRCPTLRWPDGLETAPESRSYGFLGKRQPT